MVLVFHDQRYMTKGFENTIPYLIQLLLFQMIDSLKINSDVDYLQVFILSVEAREGRTFQKIIHSQEQPSRSKTYLIPYPSPVTEKVYAIDDKGHHTFLLAEEY